MFGAFGDVKRRQPVFTFKRGAVFSAFSDHNKRPIQQPQQLQQKQPVTTQATSAAPLTKSQLHISPSSSNSTTDSDDPFEFPIAAATPPVDSSSKNAKPRSQKDDKEGKEEDDSIFDFPDSLDEFSEVKLMIASTRTVPEMPKLTRTRSKPKTKSKSAPTTPKTTTSKKKDAPIASKSESTVNTSKKRVASLNRKTSAGTANEPLATTTSKSQPNKRPPATLNRPLATTTPNRSLVTARNQALLPNSNHLPVANTVNAQPFDIFAFDPSPPSQLSYNKNTQFTHHTTPIANNSYNPYINTFSSNPVYSTDYNSIDPGNFTPFNHSLPVNNSPAAFTRNMNTQSTTSNWHHPVSIASLLNDTTQAESTSNFFYASSTQTLVQQQQQQSSSSLSTVAQTRPVEKKRKRNLVASLKSASGEKESKPLLNRGFDFLSDEEELLEQQQQNELLPLREIITNSNKERSLSPELTYAQRMELELDTMMQSEFGTENPQKSDKPMTDETQQRRRYQPLNKVNVRVTFQKK